MKSLSAFLLVFLISLTCFSQSLEGEWKGMFYLTYNPNPQYGPPPGTFVNLKFTLNKDSSYSVTSSSNGGDTIFVCDVLYKRLSKDSIYLEETKVIKPNTDVIKCFKKMNLIIQERKKSIELIGTFNYVSRGLCPLPSAEAYSGNINFIKKEKSK
jgi:hypothetical protein